ncbi:MAG: nuclear transport factor 2 family protein [Pseudomonadota bacterium]
MALDLEAIERIKRVKYAYCQAIDTCDLALLETVFAPDATVDYEGGTYRFQAEGRDNILAAIKAAFHDEFVACHSVIHPVIDVTSETTATGSWRLIDYAMNLRENNLVTIGAANYKDSYTHDGRSWRIQSSSYTRIYERVFNEPDAALTHFILGGGHVGERPSPA